MQLAKPHIDVGLFCRDVDASRAFYERSVGLPYEELLKVGGGIHQHRLGLRGAVLKLNASRETLAKDHTCLRVLAIATPHVTTPVDLHDPDGVLVRLVPVGYAGVKTVGVTWASRDPVRLGELLAAGLGATGVGVNAWRVGTTLLHVLHDPAAQRTAGQGFFRVHADSFRRFSRLFSDVGSAGGSAPATSCSKHSPPPDRALPKTDTDLDARPRSDTAGRAGHRL